MDRKRTVSVVIGLCCSLSFLTAISNLLLSFYSFEEEHILAFFLGIILTMIWGLIFMALLATFVMLIKNQTDNYKALYDESPITSQI